MGAFGMKLKSLRQGKKMSLRELGKATGLSHSFIADMESGRSKPSLKSTKALAKVLEVDPRELTAVLLEETSDNVADLKAVYQKKSTNGRDKKK